jgi:hypothetical protein
MVGREDDDCVVEETGLPQCVVDLHGLCVDVLVKLVVEPKIVVRRNPLHPLVVRGLVALLAQRFGGQFVGQCFGREIKVKEARVAGDDVLDREVEKAGVP